MVLETLDWLLIGLFVAITLFVGLKFAGRAGQSLGEFFLSGRKLTWYVAGFSMVATTFAADTPLYVTEEVGQNGISGNWLWWNMLIGGMLTTFFFARLWRRAGILTDLEFIELRYGGKPAAFLRGFKSVYLGLLMNAVIIAWVNVALASILHVFFNIPEEETIWYVGGAMVFVAAYSSLAGLWGIAINDFIQFAIAITGCIVLAILVVNSEQIGGIAGLQAKLPESTLNFLPTLGGGDGGMQNLSIGIAGFIAFVGVQWWASWYPGSEPGGGGYVAQRMMSAKDERSSQMATLFFQIAHYCIRSWPWILVGLCVIVLYPELEDENRRLGYVYAMRDFLPAGLKGLLLVTFLAAYMSTISTQLNWGTSYLINDLYKRFLKPSINFASEKQGDAHYVAASRIGTLLLMVFAFYITTQVTTIKSAWEFIIQGSAGMGLVLILRWYWWRINAWSEIVATVTPLLAYGLLKLWEYFVWQNWKLAHGKDEMATAAFESEYWYFTFPYSFFITVAVATVAWIIATYMTKPEKPELLRSFYDRVQPGGNWGPVATTEEAKTGGIGYQLLSWLSGIAMTYALLFLVGNVIFQRWEAALITAAIAIAGFIGLRIGLGKSRN
ncbi:MAG: sodium:solute symporter family protein [Bacteroidia bacterium]